MENESDRSYDYEVDLRKYIQVLWKEKWIILLVVVAAAGVAYGFSGAAPSQYKAQTTLLITPRVSEQMIKGSEGGLSTTPLSTKVYKKSALANDLLQGIIEKLDLRNGKGDKMSVASLQDKLTAIVGGAEENEGTNTEATELSMVSMTVNGKKPERIRKIANTWADLFVENNTELLSSETARSYEFISGRFEEVSKKLTRKEQAELEYKKDHPLSVLKDEVKVLQSNYRDFLTDLQKKRAELQQQKAQLKSIEGQLKEEPKYLELERTMPGESLWNLLRKEKYDNVTEDKAEFDELKRWTDLKLLDQKMNSIYFNLKQDKLDARTKIDSLEEEIDYLEGKTREFSRQIKEKQFRIDRIQLRLKQFNREIDRLDNTYKKLSDTLEEARIASEEKESSIRLMEQAVTPTEPVGQNTIQKLFVAGVLGLFLGVLAAFFKNYIQGYEFEEESEEENGKPETKNDNGV